MSDDHLRKRAGLAIALERFEREAQRGNHRWAKVANSLRALLDLHEQLDATEKGKARSLICAASDLYNALWDEVAAVTTEDVVHGFVRADHTIKKRKAAVARQGLAEKRAPLVADKRGALANIVGRLSPEERGVRGMQKKIIGQMTELGHTVTADWVSRNLRSNKSAN